MRSILFLVLGIFLLGGAGNALGATVGDWVQVEIRAGDGRPLPLYPASSTSFHKKVYAEAVKGSEYTVWIRNLLSRRVGIVVAVDGRNIISGKKSWLKNHERMYILGPHENCEYRGWRTGTDRVNRFYFTDAGDSYAAAFGDSSALGSSPLPSTRRCFARKPLRPQRAFPGTGSGPPPRPQKPLPQEEPWKAPARASVTRNIRLSA